MNFEKTDGIEIPREDGQAFEVGRVASAVERILDYVTCWQLEIQKGVSGDKATKIP